METTKTIFIAVPTGKVSPYPEFWEHLANVKPPDGYMLYPPRTSRGPYIKNNQNTLIRMFLHKTNAEYFFLANDDQLYADDILKRLMSHQKDIVVPLCPEHELPCRALIYTRRDGDLYYHKFLESSDRGLVPVVGSGGGGMLIHRRVLEAIPDPWFTTHMSNQMEYPKEFLNNEDPQLCGWVESTEDLDFCKKVIDAGFGIYCDLDTTVLHSTTFYIAYARQPNGQWCVVLMRNGKHVAIPMPQAPLSSDPKILIPQFA